MQALRFFYDLVKPLTNIVVKQSVYLNAISQFHKLFEQINR